MAKILAFRFLFVSSRIFRSPYLLKENNPNTSLHNRISQIIIIINLLPMSCRYTASTYLRSVIGKRNISVIMKRKEFMFETLHTHEIQMRVSWYAIRTKTIICCALKYHCASETSKWIIKQRKRIVYRITHNYYCNAVVTITKYVSSV